MPTFQRGACLGRYVVLHTVGSGGMGEVYAAYDPELDRKVAIKLLRSDRVLSSQRPGAEMRLRREAQAAAKLNHPNVVAVHDVGQVGGRLFMAMELIEGSTLEAWRRREARTWREVLDVLVQAGRGLAAAHGVGLIHRDFKPSNVMVGDDGRVQVVDFGLVRLLDRRAGTAAAGDSVKETLAEAPEGLLDASLTVTGKTLGTPAYMAPEQYAATAVDVRADQFSFCMVLYEALYGQLPFAGATAAEIQHSVARREMREPPAGAPVPGWLRRVLRRGLEAEPAARFASMDELLLALRPGAGTRRHLRLATAALSALALLVFAYFERHEPSICRGAGERLEGIWDAPRQTAIRRAFLASGVPSAQDTWRAAKKQLDTYAGAWVGMHTETCEATHVHGDQSTELLDLRMACLETRLHEMKTLTGLWRRSDVPSLRRAVVSAAGLTVLAGCADRRALAALPPRPGDGVRVSEVRRKIAEARVLEASGKYQEALAMARDVVAAAAKIPYRPLQGEAHLMLAVAQGRFRRVPEMRRNLLDALEIALAARHDELLVETTSMLIINAFLRHDVAEARDWGRLAKAAIERLGGRGDLEARRLTYLGVALNATGHHNEAIEHYQAALETYDEVTMLHRAQAVHNIALAHIRAGRYEQAEEPAEQALRLFQEIYGEEHVLIAKPLGMFASLLQGQKRWEEALAISHRSLSIYEKNVGPDYPESAFDLTDIGHDLIELGRAAEALPQLEESIRLQERHPEDSPSLAEARFLLARALARSGQDPARARELAQRARDAYAASGEASRGELAEVEAWLSRHEAAP